jgi:phosphoenolpyruvate carboxykinase (ATP)
MNGNESTQKSLELLGLRDLSDVAHNLPTPLLLVVLNCEHRLILVGGTHFAGEIKKVACSYFNYILPHLGTLSAHAAANLGNNADSALFFWLSGTGMTTLSTDLHRRLIGDDEIGWSERGVFNLEGGCYAKVTHIVAEAEPEIFHTTRLFGTILENVGFDPVSARVDLDDAAYTENTRAAFPISHIPCAVSAGTAGHPTTIFMLTADAFGVLPPIAKLSAEQAVYYFLSGYTAKIGGTEAGVVEPTAAFSPCFGAPFMSLAPTVYAKLLRERLAQHKADVWLVNTGWIGGPYGTGERMPIAATRALIRAANDGSLRDTPTRLHAIFGVQVPLSCPGVSAKIPDPRENWSDGDVYDKQALELANLFRRNFGKFESACGSAIASAGPICASERAVQ